MRWWADPVESLSALRCVDDADPEIGVGIAMLGYHGIAASRMGSLPPVSDASTVREVLSGLDVEPVRKALERAVSGVSDSPSEYSRLMAEDIHHRAVDATVSLVRRMQSAGVPWPVAVARAAAVHGVPAEKVSAYTGRMLAPAVPDPVRDDAADRLLHEYAAELGSAVVSAGSVSKGESADAGAQADEWEEKEHPRGRDGRFVAASSGGEGEAVADAGYEQRRRRRMQAASDKRVFAAHEEARAEKERADRVARNAERRAARSDRIAASDDELRSMLGAGKAKGEDSQKGYEYIRSQRSAATVRSAAASSTGARRDKGNTARMSADESLQSTLTPTALDAVYEEASENMTVGVTVQDDGKVTIGPSDGDAKRGATVDGLIRGESNKAAFEQDVLHRNMRDSKNLGRSSEAQSDSEIADRDPLSDAARRSRDMAAARLKHELAKFAGINERSDETTIFKWVRSLSSVNGNSFEALGRDSDVYVTASIGLTNAEVAKPPDGSAPGDGPKVPSGSYKGVLGRRVVEIEIPPGGVFDDMTPIKAHIKQEIDILGEGQR